MTAESDTPEYIVHTVSDDRPGPWCGAPDPGPINFEGAFKVRPCLDCLSVGADGIPYSHTLAGRLDVVRERLALKRRLQSPAERDAFKESLLAVGAASLVDPSTQPPLYDTPELLAALYAIGAVRGAIYQANRAGIRLSGHYLNHLIDEVEIIIVAIVEGVPE